MPHHTELLSRGMRHYNAGRLDAAVAVCQKIISAEPACADAYHILGLVSQRKRDLDTACSYLRKAADLEPESALYHYCLGNLLLEKGDAALAYNSFQHALQLEPHNAAAHYGTALILHRAGRHEEAATAYRRALETRPDFLEALCNLGAVMHAIGRLDTAVDCFRKAVQLHPGNDRLQYSLGAALQADRQFTMAESAYREALNINPSLLEARFNLGILLRDSGRLDEATTCFKQLVGSNPNLADAHHNLAIVYNLSGNPQAARAALHCALNAQPDHPAALNSLGNLLMSSGDFHAAAGLFSKALQLTPDNPKLHFNLGAALKELPALESAQDSFETALRLDPGMDKAFAECFRIRQHLCDWSTYPEDLEKLLHLNQQCLAAGKQSPIYPFDALSLPVTAAEQRQIAASWASEFSARVTPFRSGFVHRDTSQTRRLRIGYVSANFNNHAESHLTASMFGLHDRNRYEVFAYSTGKNDGSKYRQRIQDGCEHFIDVQHDSDIEVANRIFADGIQILVDLAVYNKHTATGIFALRPALAQVSYLGYPGTSGADFYDYILTDRVVTPPDQQPYYTEQFVYLPNCYQVNDHELTLPEPDHDRTKYGLPQTGFIFCCFNNAYKIEPSVFDAWMRILDRVPASVLWLLDHGELTSTNLRLEAERRGIDGARIAFAPKLAKEAHLARHRHANLFLDTRYYNAHTTASDALRAGVPIITLSGQTFAARVAASLLHAAGMQELITTTMEEYMDLCVALATDEAYYRTVAGKLASSIVASPIFDAPQFVRDLEQAYENMWQSIA